MIPLETRSYKKEFLDSDNIAVEDLSRNLYELDVINKYLGGYNATLNGFKTILQQVSPIKNVLDIGFGGGDSIKQLAKTYCVKYPGLFFYGVDLKQDCVDYAERNLGGFKNKELICKNYKDIAPALLQKIDVIHCSLFLHHLNDDEIVGLLRFCKQHNCIFLANDLHRQWLAYYSIKLLTALFSKSYLVKNDAPLSVARGFKRKELMALLQKAGYTNYSVKWSWAFRYILIAYK